MLACPATRVEPSAPGVKLKLTLPATRAVVAVGVGCAPLAASTLAIAAPVGATVPTPPGTAADVAPGVVPKRTVGEAMAAAAAEACPVGMLTRTVGVAAPPARRKAVGVGGTAPGGASVAVMADGTVATGVSTPRAA